MRPERTRLVRALLIAAALVVLDFAGTRLFDALGLAERLFAGGGLGALAAIVTLVLVCGRAALSFVIPPYLSAVLIFWMVAKWKPARDSRRVKPC